MLKKRCTLCGGNLVQGKCVECGLNNNKKRMTYAEEDMEKFKPWARSSEAFEQIYKEEPKREYEKHDERPPIQRRPPQPNVSRPRPPMGEHKSEDGPPEKKPLISRVIKWMVIIFFFQSIFGSLIGNLIDVFDDLGEENYNYETYVNTVDLESLQLGEIPLEETGVSYEETLVAGYYKVGVNIPEGIYSITCLSNGSIEVDDDANDLFCYTYFATDNIGEVHTGVYLYEGSIIHLDNEAVLIFKTDNANLESMETIENPNTETIELTETAIAGVDFPAGVYNIFMPEDTFGIMRLYACEEDLKDEYSYVDSAFMSKSSIEDEDDSYEMSAYYNIVIPEGYVLYIDEDSDYLEYLILEPSEVIENESYELQAAEIYD